MWRHFYLALFAMLQHMVNLRQHTPFNMAKALTNNRLLPFKATVLVNWTTCVNCNFLNLSSYHYCTCCGYPVQPNNDRVKLYTYRLQQRKELLQKLEMHIMYARNTLYILAAVCMMGVAYFFTDDRQNILRGFASLTVAAIFTGLGRWSLIKPFTALLISFLMVLTFIAINTWAQFMDLFTTTIGLYTLLIQIVCFLFLTRGLQAAYKADIMEEEFKI